MGRGYRMWAMILKVGVHVDSRRCSIAGGWMHRRALSLHESAGDVLGSDAASFAQAGAIAMYKGTPRSSPCMQVGTGLGAGDARAARTAALAAVWIAPVAWAMAAAVLLLPRGQDLLIRLFTTGSPAPPGPNTALHTFVDLAASRQLLQGGYSLQEVPDPGPGSGPGQGGAEPLAECLRHMFVLVALLILWDGVQTILSGVVQALGAQRRGAAINAGERHSLEKL